MERYTNQRRYADAEPLYQRSLAIREKALGPDHPNIAQSLTNLASLYNRQGRYAEAEPMYWRSLAKREKALDRDHPDLAFTLINLAALTQAHVFILCDLDHRRCRTFGAGSPPSQTWEAPMPTRVNVKELSAHDGPESLGGREEPRSCGQGLKDEVLRVPRASSGIVISLQWQS